MPLMASCSKHLSLQKICLQIKTFLIILLLTLRKWECGFSCCSSLSSRSSPVVRYLQKWRPLRWEAINSFGDASIVSWKLEDVTSTAWKSKEKDILGKIIVPRLLLLLLWLTKYPSLQKWSSRFSTRIVTIVPKVKLKTLKRSSISCERSILKNGLWSTENTRTKILPLYIANSFQEVYMLFMYRYCSILLFIYLYLPFIYLNCDVLIYLLRHI